MIKQITLEVEAPIADAYHNATPEHRQALQAIVSLYLQSISISFKEGTVSDRDILNKKPQRTTIAHLIGKGETLGDIVSPIVDEED
jgi:hypothetical protein